MPAPAIEGTTVDGEPLALTDYRGKAVLVNVWSSW
jgi:peroxiredoxin